MLKQEDLTKNAQLVFNTHDTKLLSLGLFRRDQVWFAPKNKLGDAQLYSLSDFKSKDVRKTNDFEVRYINGRYGAVPYLEFFDDIIKRLPQPSQEQQKSQVSRGEK